MIKIIAIYDECNDILGKNLSSRHYSKLEIFIKYFFYSDFFMSFNIFNFFNKKILILDIVIILIEVQSLLTWKKDWKWEKISAICLIIKYITEKSNNFYLISNEYLFN